METAERKSLVCDNYWSGEHEDKLAATHRIGVEDGRKARLCDDCYYRLIDEAADGRREVWWMD
jgi:hypothetical protein